MPPCALIRFWCRSEAEPLVGYWGRGRSSVGGVPRGHPADPDDVTGWEPIADQAAARAVQLEQVRRAGATAMLVGTMKAARRTAAPTGRRARKPAVVVGR
jgi:hypothetical protein